MILNETRPHKESYSLKVLIVIAMLFSPFTELRIGPIGVTEIAIFVFILVVLFQKRILINKHNRNNFIFTKFWVMFSILSTTGLFYNYVIRGHVSGDPNSMIYDFASYVFVAIACFTLEVKLSHEKPGKIWEILKWIYILTSIVIFILFILSIFVNSLMGFTINYYRFFRPFATNIHHISMGLAPLPFIGMKLLSEEKNRGLKILWLLSIVSNLLAANATGSLKVLMGFVIGIIVFLYFWINSQIKNGKLRKLVFIFMSIIIILLLSINYEVAMKYVFDFFIAEDIGGGRANIWSSSIDKILRSPLIGYGPGAHAQYYPGSFNDAHQTFLTALLQGGVFAFVAYVSLFTKIIQKCKKNPYILGSVSAVLIYALGGDILRRIPMWIFLMLFYYYSNNEISSNIHK